MQFDVLYMELAQSTEIIRALLNGISQADAQIKPNTESWSMLEVICHLYDEEREDFREHLDLILHRQNETWQAIDPQGWVKERRYNEQNFNEMQEKFFTERKKSMDWLDNLRSANMQARYKSQWGEVTAGDMFCSWVAHDNLHIRQLVELRRSRIERIAQPNDIEYAGDWQLIK